MDITGRSTSTSETFTRVEGVGVALSLTATSERSGASENRTLKTPEEVQEKDQKSGVREKKSLEGIYDYKGFERSCKGGKEGVEVIVKIGIVKETLNFLNGYRNEEGIREVPQGRRH